MFIKRPIHGLKPLTTYEVEARVAFLSKAPTGCIGIGGDPGASVYVKFGTSAEEPSPVIQADGMLRMNVDIGYQSNGGTNAEVIGNIAATITDCQNVSGASHTFTNNGTLDHDFFCSTRSQQNPHRFTAIVLQTGAFSFGSALA
jgi:hypothetical protein